MGRDMCFVLLPPSFVLIDSTCILSCAIIWIVHAFFHVLLYGSISQLNKSNEELKMKQWCLYFHISFPFFVLFCFLVLCLFVCFSRLCKQSRDVFGVTIIYLRRTKIKRTISSIDKRPTT